VVGVIGFVPASDGRSPVLKPPLPAAGGIPAEVPGEASVPATPAIETLGAAMPAGSLCFEQATAAVMYKIHIADP
jgi:hypothetical protein